MEDVDEGERWAWWARADVGGRAGWRVSAV
jgi:hypothetical protein